MSKIMVEVDTEMMKNIGFAINNDFTNGLIEKIKEFAVPDFEYHGCGGSQLIVELDDVIEIIKEYCELEGKERTKARKLSGLKRLGDWIPCSEKLPEKNGMYLVTQLRYGLSKPKGYGYPPEEKEVDYVEYQDGWRRANFYDVLAWMPLPTPYEESEE